MARNTRPDDTTPDSDETVDSAAPVPVDATDDPFAAMVSVPGGTPTQALATVDEDDVPRATSVWTDTPVFEAHELGYPRLRLGQGLTPEVAEGNAKMGQWLFSGYDPQDVVTVVPILMARSRGKRGDPSDRESDITCTSDDALTGYGDPGGSCRTCPFAKWDTDPKTGRRKPPACQLTYKYAVWVVELETLAEVSFTRTSEQYANLINNQVVRAGMGRFAIEMRSTIKRGAGRMWAEPQLRVVPLTAEIIANAGGMLGEVPGTAPTIVTAG